MEGIESLLSNFGFPVAMVIMMWRFMTSTLQKMQQSLNELSQSVSENTQAIKELRRDLHRQDE